MIEKIIGIILVIVGISIGFILTCLKYAIPCLTGIIILKYCGIIQADLSWLGL